MSKILLVNGSPHKEGCTYTALKEIADTLAKEGVDSEIYWIGNEPLHGCIACGKCKKSEGCAFGDGGVNAIGARLDEFDGIVLGSPVYYASCDGQIHSFADRLWFAYGRKMAGKVGASVVSCRRGGASAAFDALNKYFSISKMPIATSQYWNQVHGRTPEEVVQDIEGMQTMRTLGQNIAWLVKCIDAGKKAGVDLPVYEAPTFTNYIR